MAVLGVILIVLIVTTLAGLGLVVPWSPHMDAWSAVPTPVEYVKGRTPLELQGALVIQNKQCRTCHALEGRGGERGPTLDGVATRLTRDQLIRQVLQGGGNMPAYGRNPPARSMRSWPSSRHSVPAARCPRAHGEPRPGADDGVKGARWLRKHQIWPCATARRREQGAQHTGRTDIPLTGAGRHQAEVLRRHLGGRPFALPGARAP